MYTIQEMARLRESFWTTFGKYMAPVPSADGEKINWINYKTGIKHLRLALEIYDDYAIAGIFITHPEQTGRMEHYDKLLQLKTVFLNTVAGEWIWEPEAKDESGRNLARIYRVLPGKKITRQDDWPDIISFFKSSIITLDEFWQMVKDDFLP